MTDHGIARAALRSPLHATPSWWPSSVYYGWALVTTLGVTATVSYGILYYAFAVFISPMGAELGWSKTQITGAFSVAQLVAGASAIGVGRWVDRHGARGLMTAGSTLAALLLVIWSLVHSLVAFYAVWALMGVAMAAVLYEPAFAVVATWFRVKRSRALTILTFIGGFASVIFVPLATWLVAREGWRAALLALAAILAVLTVLPHAVVLRRRPDDVGLLPDGFRDDGRDAGPDAHQDAARRRRLSSGGTEAARAVVRTAGFRWIAAAFTLSALTSTSVAVHLVPLLLERGYSIAFAGGAMGALGLMALPGRLIFTPLGDRWTRGPVTASIFGLQTLSLVVLLSTRSVAGIWIFVGLFGAGFGAITPARAALVGDLVEPDAYGRVSGVLALIVSLARAAAPVGASLLYVAGGGPRGGYDALLVVLLALCVVSGAAVLAATGRKHIRMPRAAAHARRAAA
ncbi:MAG TPA: MFS transporter [Gemmatimonadaceae bacterium]|nr:MFS transporter [Gemmatimonadaceae bacterium]